MRARLPAGLAAIALAAGLSSASAPFAAQEPLVFGTEARLVAVPVFVMDRRGNAVAGLTAADFEVEDQGKKAEVVAFQAIDVEAAAAEAEAGPLEAAARRQFVCVMVWTGTARAGAQPPLGVEALLEGAAGSTHKLALAGAPRVVRDADGIERYVVNPVVRGVAAGEYRLRLDFADPASGRTARSEGAVRVE